MSEAQRPTIRIVVLDDHTLFRESVARLLNAEADFKVVATCGSIKEGLAIIRQHPTDIVLLDLDLGQSDGSQFLCLARKEGYKGKVLVVTAGVEREKAADLIRGGVSGIFTKNNSAASLTEGIHHVIAGKVWFDQELLHDAIGRVRARSENQAVRFTERERLVLSGVFDGLANKEIAERIAVSESSIKATLQQLFSKTGVRTRSQLVRVAFEHFKNEIQ
jgi:two-component system nitrate/nitrite response regulator NarL